MARATMSDLIGLLRGHTQAGTADYTLGTVSYWSDDHLQAVLDRYRQEILREPLQKIGRDKGGGTTEYYEHQSAYRNFERTSGGTSIFIVADGLGNASGTANYSADYMLGRVEFTTNTDGTAYYLTGRAYNVYAAAADVWRQKAGYSAASFDFSTDNMSVKRSQVQAHCMGMATYYEGLSGPTVIEMTRNDIDPQGGW